MLRIVAYCRQYVQKTTRRMIVQAALQSCALLDFIGNAMILFGKWIVSANF